MDDDDKIERLRRWSGWGLVFIIVILLMVWCVYTMKP